MDNSPLKKLPAELRNDIFAMAMREELPVELFSKRSTKYRISYRGHAISQTCKQLRNETLLMSYAESTFNFNLNDNTHEPGADRFISYYNPAQPLDRKGKLALKWLANLAREKRQAIKNITMTTLFVELWAMHVFGHFGRLDDYNVIVQLADKFWAMGIVYTLAGYRYYKRLVTVEDTMDDYLGYDFRPFEYEWDCKGEVPKFLRA